MQTPLPPVHPGEILRDEFLIPHQLRPNTAAKLLGVPRTSIERIVAATQPITADTALRLALPTGSVRC